MVRIEYVKEIPYININGELIEPMAFRTFRPKPDNISLMSRVGVRLCQMLVSGLPCSNGSPYSLFGGVWKGEGVYDFEPFERQYKMFSDFAPDSYYNIMIQLDSPEWQGYDSYHHITELAHCEKWRRSAADYLRAFIRYAEEKHGDRIFAYSIAAGYSNEWFDQSLYESDYNREGNVLTGLWRKETGGAEISDAKAPTVADMEAGEGMLREPCSDHFKYLKLAAGSTSGLINFFAGEAQKELKHEKLFGLFYGYSDMDNQIYWNTDAYESVWSNPDIDMLYSPAAYRKCREIGGVSSYQYTVDSIAVNGKLYLHENDHRTALAAFPLENGVMLNDCYGSFYEWQQVFRRELANVMSKRSAFWWFDFFGGYYNAPEYERELKLEAGLYRELARGRAFGREVERLSEGSDSLSEIAVFTDPISFLCTKENTKLCTDLVRENIKELHRCGAPFDHYNLSDITRLELSKFKLLIFTNTFIMDENIRSFIEKELSDKTRVFVYGSGMAVGGKLDIRNTAKLCGIGIERYSPKEKPEAIYEDESFSFTGTSKGDLFRVNDGAADVISRYSDGSVAVAQKGKTIYSALGRLPWKLWRDIALGAGVRIYDVNGGGLAVCSRFVCSYTMLGEECELRLPSGSYRELFSGESYECFDGRLAYKARLGQTMLFVKL